VEERCPKIGSLVIDKNLVNSTPGIVVEVRPSPCPGRIDSPDEVRVVYPTETDSSHWYRADRIRIVEESQKVLPID
jgi:hypothetical protein